MAGYVGNPDFHDGQILARPHVGDRVEVTVKGYSGKQYIVRFEGVALVESESPEGMTLYALGEGEPDEKSLQQYHFINEFVDDPEGEKSQSYLRIVAKGFTLSISG
jgi:hypothetical protein